MTTQRRSNRRIILAPYHMRVSAAREIAAGVGGLRIYPENSRYVPRLSDVVINWGRSSLPEALLSTVINPAAGVRMAVDKESAWLAFVAAAVPTVEFTRDMSVARQWQSEGHVVLHRDRLRGRGGEGIRVYQPNDEYPMSDRGVYVKYFKKRREYRVHVFGDDVIDVQEKRKRRGAQADPYVRTHDNGWVFCRENVECPEGVKTAALAAVRALGLTFGGVDVGWNEHYQRPCVFEVNTAPGIEGSTVTAYSNKIKELAA